MVLVDWVNVVVYKLFKGCRLGSDKKILVRMACEYIEVVFVGFKLVCQGIFY